MKQTRIFTPAQIHDLCEYFTEVDGTIHHNGKPVKTYLNSKGYHKVKYPPILSPTSKRKDCIRIYVSRLVFILHNKTNPDIVDHIDHCVTNNKIENLRNSTHSQNNLNGKKRKGKSIYIGVIKRTDTYKNGQTHINCWRARATIGNKRITVGHYPTEIEAAKARDAYIRKNASPEDLYFYKFNFEE